MKRIKILSMILLPVLCLLTLAACAPEAQPPAAAPAAEPAYTVQQQASEEALAPTVPAAAPIVETEPSVPEAPAVPAASAAPAPVAEQEDKASIRLEGAGLKDPMSLSLEELKAMEASIYGDDFFSLNSYGTKEYFHFKGVKLSAVLQKAGLKKEAATVTVVASDGYKLELSIEQALKEDYIDEQDPAKKYPVLIAWQENGSDYDAAAGYPFRLVIGQKEAGDVNKPQWVMNIAKIIVN